MADMGAARDVALMSLVVGLKQIAKALTGRDLRGTADISMPEPPYFKRFTHLVPKVRWDQPVTQLVFDSALLDLPLVVPDRVALLLAREQCEKELRALGFDGALVERARRLLPKPDGFRSLAELAEALRTSPRTLERRLAARGFNYSKLLDQERCEKALLLLRSPEITIEEITERLGYSTVPNFVRAFRRWTGKTPAAYRRGKKAEPTAT
jgi:AraC-like DNA-binding protein